MLGLTDWLAETDGDTLGLIEGEILGLGLGLTDGLIL